MLSKVFFLDKRMSLKNSGTYSIKCDTKTEIRLKITKFVVNVKKNGSLFMRALTPKDKNLGLDEYYLMTPLGP